MTAEMFETWFDKQLLANLPSNSAIVLDNASYHSVQLKKIPNTSSKKGEIQNFLTEHGLYFEENYTKAQLLEVLHTRKFEKQYKIDAMPRDRGFRVIRLPPYHCIFNPIELIWSQMKNNIRRNNTAPKFSSATINIIREEASKITAETWANCVRHSIKEDQYRARLINPLIINLEESSDDDSDYFDQ
ncbi:hypothetical protein Zmor_014892 [Zophobas morio]|uniref:Tc1-like transposase DDE domain-containing protein n=1 Tax=Zophobas morio TaxID=2755281 RepID=A0AA38MHF4_9CUCU|nr:hypothetical protein Zmor_014892 [Zophobas morio]